MTESETEPVPLHRVECARDLWAAIEVAQYGHLVTWDQLETEIQTEACEVFRAAFGDLVEIWDDTPDASRDTVIARLDRHIAILDRSGLSLFWGMTECLVDADAPAPLSITVIYVSPADAPGLHIVLPRRFSTS